MKFYAYIPKEDGSAPMGTANKLLFELKTHKGAIRRAGRLLGNPFCVFTYRNFYDSKTFKDIKGLK